MALFAALSVCLACAALWAWRRALGEARRAASLQGELEAARDVLFEAEDRAERVRETGRRALLDAEIRAEAAARARARLLAAVAEEMREPLAGVVGAVRLLLDGRLAPEERGCARAALGSAEATLGLLDQIRDLAGAEPVDRRLGAAGAEPPSASDAASSALAFPQAGGLKVLVAEDDPVGALIALAYLARLGHASVHVADGEAACAAFERERFDAALIDIRMPRLDGHEVARRIRAAEAETGRASTLLLALTAAAADAAREAGMDGFVAKPLDLRALEEALAPLVAPASADRAPRRLARVAS